MGLTSALNTSVNGLTLNETSIDVIGNNIANAGTTGYKASNVLFATQLSRTLGIGSAPTATNGGTNPRQVGLGAVTAAIQRDFSSGGVTSSANPSALAIQGDGFFVVTGPEGQLYTRDGNFSRNSAGELVTAQGQRVQGYGVDENFNIVEPGIQDIRIPLGELTVAQQTQSITLGGALLSTGETGTQGALLTSENLFDGSAAPGTAATAATLLVDVRNAGGVNLYTAGQTLSFSARKGGAPIGPETLAITTTTTVAELLTLMDSTLGIQSGGSVPNDPNGGGQPGVDIVGGQIRVIGNQGSDNDISLSVGDLIADASTVPVAFNKSESATGESTFLNVVVYDSLGQELQVKVTTVLESRDSNFSYFRYYVESADDSDVDMALANGILTFDSRGRVVDGGTASFSIDRNNTAALSPMLINLDFSSLSGISSAAAGSGLSLTNQDGLGPGTLSSFIIDESGIINGIFDNGATRPLGQVALARFANPQGLLDAGSNAYRAGVSSGAPFVTAPGTFGVGTVRSGAIELSNTDIGRSLVDLIVASTNYRGNSRVISSVQELVDELLVLGR